MREQYAAWAARPPAQRDADARGRAVDRGYTAEELEAVPESARASLGCGNPTALAGMREGETVLDLGCGTGLDAFLAARRVGPTGKVIGVDMTAAAVEKARAAAGDGYPNVEFRVGPIEKLPVPDESVDVVLSNCVLNHCADKAAAFREAWRVLRPGGRLHVSDLVTQGVLPPAGTPGLEVWAEWLRGAADRQTYLAAVREGGWREVAILSEQAFTGPLTPPLLADKILSLHVRAVK
jgi:SAM-dependent methyltransferase